MASFPTPRSPASPPAGLFQDLREGARLPTFAQDASQREGVARVQGLGCRLWRGLFRRSFFRRAVFVSEDAVVIRGILRVASAPAVVVRLEGDVRGVNAITRPRRRRRRGLGRVPYRNALSGAAESDAQHGCTINWLRLFVYSSAKWPTSAVAAVPSSRRVRLWSRPAIDYRSNELRACARDRCALPRVVSHCPICVWRCRLAEGGATKNRRDRASLNRAEPAASVGSVQLREKPNRHCAPPQRLISACRQAHCWRCLARQTSS